jgi:hypothetical protein
VGQTSAFISVNNKSPATSLYANKNPQYFDQNNLAKVGSSFVAAATIFVSSLVTDLAVASPASAELDLSRGALIVQSTSQPGQSLLKGEIDTQSLVKTVFKNRKELGLSAGRIKLSIQDELKQPVWQEIQKEIVNIEGDVLPSIHFTPPSDFRETLKDISNGKLNFLINGEIVNIAVVPTFSDKEDDLIIRVTGFKGEQLLTQPKQSFQPPNGPIRTWLSQFKTFWSFWDDAYPTKVSFIQHISRFRHHCSYNALYVVFQYSFGVQATNGQILLTGAAATVGLVYIFSYTYYTQLQEEEEAEAAAKRAAVAEKKKEKKKAEAEAKARAPEKGNVKVIKEGKAKKDTEVKVERSVSKVEVSTSSVKRGGKRRRFRFWKKE